VSDGARESVGRCEGCGGGDLRLLRTAPSLYGAAPIRFERCAGCGLIFQSPRPTEAEARAGYASSHAAGPTLEDEAAAVRIYETYLGAVVRRAGLSVGARVLDIGCGRGTALGVARDRFGWVGVGVDLSEERTREGREKRGLNLIRADFRDLPSMALGSFDLATAFQVLEHLHRPGALFDVVRAMVRPGGWFLVNVPRYSRLNEAFVPRFWDDAHLFYFTEATLDGFAARAGFSKEAVLPSPSPSVLKRAALATLAALGMPAGVLTVLFRRDE
jgi:SAM-dependent methyltransferase